MVRHSLLAVLFALLTASAASATTFSFGCISGDGGGDCAVPAVSLEVTDLGGGQISFTITNNDDEPSRVAGVYFEDEAGALDELASVLDGSGVDFEEGGSPADLPGGNVQDFEADFAVTAQPPAPQNGAGPGESVTIVFDLASGFTFADVIDAMEAGELRVGLHAPAVGTGGNHSLLASGEPVPEPAAFALLLVGLGAVALRRR